MNTNRDIAASLIVDADPVATDPAQPEQNEETTAEDVTTETADTSEEDQDQDDVQTGDDAEDVDDDEEQASSEDDDPDPEEVSGDSYTFKVDGEDVTVSVEDLIRNYSIDGAAQKRLQEATEARKAATESGYREGMETARAEIQTRSTELENMRQEFSDVVGFVGQQLFAAQVERPDPAMEVTDPIGYLSKMEAWRQEQGRLQAMQQQITEFAANQGQHTQKLRAERQQMERLALREKRPELMDHTIAREFTSDVRRAQNALGMSQAEVDNFPDHRGLLALELAGKFLKMAHGDAPTPAQKIVKATGKKKSLRPGAVTYQRSSKQKARRADRDKAKASGSYKDVAKLLIQDAPPKR